jgi:hypothetical protein
LGSRWTLAAEAPEAPPKLCPKSGAFGFDQWSFAVRLKKTRGVAVATLALVSAPAFAGEGVRLTIPGLVNDAQRAIDTKPDPAAPPETLRIPQNGVGGGRDATLGGEGLSPKLNPPGLEFRKSF